MRALDAVEDEPVGLEHVVQAAGVLPPAAHDVRLDAAAAVDEVLDRVGDLELAAGARLDRARGVVDAGREHVDADEREVGLRLGRLLDEPHDAVAVELGDAVVLGVGHRRQQDQRVGLAARERTSTRSVMPPCSRLSPRYMTNGSPSRNGSAVSDRVRQAERLVLHDVGDPHAELRAVAGGRADLVAGLRRDDDPDLLDAGLRPSPRCRRRAPACWRPARAAWRSCA